MWLVTLLILGWSQISIGNAEKGTISSMDFGKSYAAVWDNDSLRLHEISRNNNSLFYTTMDSMGIFSISAYDTILIMVQKTSYDSIKMMRFTNLIKDTSYTIHTPAECMSLLLYNDGHLHASYPVWFLLCKSNIGIFITHSTNYGNSFYPFDTVIIDTGITGFDFTTSVNTQGDRLHLIYATKIQGKTYLYLLNGSYPGSFTTPILIDSMLPDTAHIRIYAISDTIFTVYERVSSYTIPDIDIYYAVSFYEGSLWDFGVISATTSDEVNPVIIPAVDTLKVYYLNRDQTSSPIEMCAFPSPYTNHLPSIHVEDGDFVKIEADATSHFPMILTFTQTGSGYLLYDETYSFIVESVKHFKHTHNITGVFTIDGRKVVEKLNRGIYIKDGKKVVILK